MCFLCDAQAHQRILVITYCPAPVGVPKNHSEKNMKCSKCAGRIANKVDAPRLLALRGDFDILYALCEWCSFGEYGQHLANDIARMPYRTVIDKTAVTESQLRWTP
jgi:hypothetical protein